MVGLVGFSEHNARPAVSVSVVIPVYNCEAFLMDCLASIEAQTVPPKEIILVDDGSEDGSVDICRNWQLQMGDLVHVITKTNSGPLDARRMAYPLLTGDYVLHVDADDYLSACTIEAIIDSAMATDADVILFDYCRASKREDIIRVLPVNDSMQFSGDSYGKILSYCARGRLNSLWCKAVKRTIVEAISFTNSMEGMVYAEDALVSAKLLSQAHSAFYCRKSLYHYRNRTGSTENTFRSKDLDDCLVWWRELDRLSRKWCQRFPSLASIVDDARINIAYNIVEHLTRAHAYGGLPLLKRDVSIVISDDVAVEALRSAYSSDEVKAGNRLIFKKVEEGHLKALAALLFTRKCYRGIVHAFRSS